MLCSGSALSTICGAARYLPTRAPGPECDGPRNGREQIGRVKAGWPDGRVSGLHYEKAGRATGGPAGVARTHPAPGFVRR